jgi:hypothetical protein
MKFENMNNTIQTVILNKAISQHIEFCVRNLIFLSSYYNHGAIDKV